jgi:hypothetical protein
MSTSNVDFGITAVEDSSDFKADSGITSSYNVDLDPISVI